MTDDRVALFRYLPRLASRVPMAPLGHWPTPLDEITVDGRPLWVKREGASSPLYGGNKVRTLEAWLGHARGHGAKRIWAIGAYGSNHAIATVLHARALGLDAGAILFPQPASPWAIENAGALIASGCPIVRLRNVVEVPFAGGAVAAGSWLQRVLGGRRTVPPFLEQTPGDRSAFGDESARGSAFGDESARDPSAFGDESVRDPSAFGDESARDRSTFGDESARGSAFGDESARDRSTFGDESARGSAFGDEPRRAPALDELVRDAVTGARRWSAVEARLRRTLASLVGDNVRDSIVMPPGGATPIGTIGALSAAFELAEQIAAGVAPPPARIVLAVGSTCTTAGLVAGLALARAVGAWRWSVPIVHAVRVTPWPVTSRFLILQLAAATLARIASLGGPRVELGASPRLVVDGRELGRGYGRLTSRGEHAMASLARETAHRPLRLDGVYSGKAAAALLRLHRDGVGPLVFWATKSTVELPRPEAPSLRAAPRALVRWLG